MADPKTTTDPFASTTDDAAGDRSNAPSVRRRGPWVIAGLVLGLIILHQDNWFWNDGTLVLGFLPIGLFWHACLSVAAALVWWLAVNIAWPLDDDVPPPQRRQPNSEVTATPERST